MASVGIVGCGVAGLTAALSLAEHGFKVEIFDRVEQPDGGIGGGLALNGALLCLTKLGYRNIYEDIMVHPRQSKQITSDGMSHVMDLGEELKGSTLEGHFGFFRRSDIIYRLYETVKQHENINVHVKHKLIDVTQNEKFANAEFENGLTKKFEALICADGIHSVGQRHIFADSPIDKPEHTGYCIYYAIMKEFPDTCEFGNVHEMSLPGYLGLIMPLRTINGEKQALFVLAYPRREDQNPNAWSYESTVDDLHNVMKADELYEKQNVIQEKHIRNIFRMVHIGIYQNPILEKWHKGRVCIIGDAAHATSPALGQGANQAMQDGYLIGKLMAENKNPSEAYAKLFEIRSPESSKIIKGSRVSIEVRAGTHWYSKLGQRAFSFLMKNFPSFMTGIMVEQFTPTFADEEFMAEVRKYYDPNVGTEI